MEYTAPINHSKSFIYRRFLNWFPLGLAYAFLYMGRYNLTVSKIALGDLMTKEDFGIIFGAGTLTYAFSFLLNGPLTDKIGGKKGMLISLSGSFIVNTLMGLYLSFFDAATLKEQNLRLVFSILYSVNMYFQSFGALSIVKVNSHWFHVRERGGFSGIFGTMIASGIFFAFTVNAWILSFFSDGTKADISGVKFVFLGPALLLFIIAIFELFVLKDSPGKAGHKDFDTGDASSGEENIVIPTLTLMKRIITNPIMLTLGLIEFCTGVLRNGIMHWFPIYAKEVLKLPENSFFRNGSWGSWYFVSIFFILALLFFIFAAKSKERKKKALFFVSGGLLFLTPFMFGGWGGLLMVAGVIGGNVAGWVSDLFFQSRRAPAAAGLYLILSVVVVAMIFSLNYPIILGSLVFLVSLCVIGTHGLLSGTATMDFGGRKGAATAVGMIDGFVYLGTGFQSLALGYITTKNWAFWPLFLLPFAVAGFFLLTRIWNSKPTARGNH